MLWPTKDDYSAPADGYALEVARALLTDQLIDTVREKLGLTYSPVIANVQSIDLPGQGFFLAGIEVPKAKFDQFRQILSNELTVLATQPISPDALARATTPIVATRSKFLESNGYWTTRTLQTLVDPRAALVYRDEITGIQRVTPDEVHRVVQSYLLRTPPLLIEVRK